MLIVHRGHHAQCRFARAFLRRHAASNPLHRSFHPISHLGHAIKTQCRTFASSSYSVDDCPYKSFAKTHRDAAQRVLTVPHFSPQDLLSSVIDEQQKTSPHILGNTLEDYLQWRGWDVEKILNENELGNNKDLVSSAIGLLSHPLTFPLTLGQCIKEVSVPQVDDYGRNEKKYSLRICCIGARAECTLPDAYWREFLVTKAMISNNQNTNIQNESDQKNFHCILDFIGPDVPSQLKSKTIELFDSDKNNTQSQQQNQHNQEMPQYKMTMNFHTLVFHEAVPRKTVHSWDMFVLFNPGCGHPNLKKKWEPTLKFILKTGKPILFTAHSAIDAERDRNVLEKLLVDEAEHTTYGGMVEYKVNPYASRMGFVDPFPSSDTSSVHIVRPNHSIFVLK